MEDLDVELSSRVQLEANQQREVRKWITREACTYFQKKNKKLEKYLPIIVWATIPYLYYYPMTGGWLVMGQDIYNEEGQRYPFFVANKGMTIPYWYSYYLMVDGS